MKLCTEKYKRRHTARSLTRTTKTKRLRLPRVLVSTALALIRTPRVELSHYIIRTHQPLPTSPSPSTSMHQPLPAHQTKHLPTLTYPFNGCTFLLAQSSDGISNGTALWLGAQLLAVYAASALNARRPGSEGRPKAVELGSGVGLTACVLHRPRPYDSLTIYPFSAAMD